jgi:hypothetical protein
MRFWTREMAGWVLVVLGLFVFYKAYGLLTAEDHRLVEGSAMTVVGLIVFRGGIHLLKVAVAADVCLEAQGRADVDRPRARPDRLPNRTVTSNVHRPLS